MGYGRSSTESGRQTKKGDGRKGQKESVRSEKQPNKWEVGDCIHLYPLPLTFVTYVTLVLVSYAQDDDCHSFLACSCTNTMICEYLNVINVLVICQQTNHKDQLFGMAQFLCLLVFTNTKYITLYSRVSSVSL